MTIGIPFTLDSLIENCSKIPRALKHVEIIRPILAIVVLLGIVTTCLSMATLIKIDRNLNNIVYSARSAMIIPNTNQQTLSSVLSGSIHIDEVMSYLNELQRIAKTSNNTRAINTIGFNGTIDYIHNYLTANTNYKISKTFFYMKTFALVRRPIFISSVNGVKKNHSYSSNLSTSDFYHVVYTGSANFSGFVQLTIIPNMGCNDEDWQKASLPPEGRVALVRRGLCAFEDKGKFATNYNVAALLFYNDITLQEQTTRVNVNLAQDNQVPALFISNAVAQYLLNAAQNSSANVDVQLTIDVKDSPSFPVANICADTPSGDATKTILIGSHSDSVLAGPGINDNGSGSAANLALAVNLARLFKTSSYPKYKYRIRFCWWGAEEQGLVGSIFHVKQAKNSTIVGERLSDYLVNLNYDMLASPNYVFGIYDGRTAKNGTPTQALHGSQKVTDLFRDWFIEHKLPWNYTEFTGQSDYGPFLAEGIAAGGLFSGASGLKTQRQRDYYDRVLGQGLGGVAETSFDPCYHKLCDSTENIHVFAYEKMIQAAAFVLEYLGRHENLQEWLYPSLKSRLFNVISLF